MKSEVLLASEWNPPAKRRRTVRSHRAGPVDFRLWLPLTPICLVLAPFAWLTLPIVAVCVAPRGIDPIRLIAGVGGVLLSASGTDIDIQGPGQIVRIRLL